jgi:hypothetical protein
VSGALSWQFNAPDTAMTDLAADSFSSSFHPSEPKAAKPAGTFWRKAAWVAGTSLIAMGLVGISMDRSLYEFDLASFWVGVLALPPVMDQIRRRLPIQKSAHAAGAALTVFGCFGWALIAPPESTAAHFTQLRANLGDVAPTWAQLPDLDGAYAKEAQADATSTKQAFLAQLASQTATLQAGVHPANYIGGRETVMEGARSLAQWRALSGQASKLTFTDEEAAQVKAFQKMVAVSSAELGPALRQSYAVSLRDRLEAYDVTAHVLGANADTIQFNGVALSDPAVQSKLRALLGKDMALLGYKTIDFAADGGADHAASEPATDSAKL